MRAFDPAKRPAQPVDPKNFTGAGTLQRVDGVSDRPAVNAYRVTFEAGTRTAWHTHSGTQLLIVVEGTCRFQKQREPVQEIGTGGIVAIDAGERHWHGASADARMVHLALNIDATTTWLEKVSDREYQGLEGSDGYAGGV